ncbi:MAG: RNA polymerase sigma factor [Planctomycetota bacterium]|jgi:RNA polymerase sigma-70 factor (ECF subfamily)
MLEDRLLMWKYNHGKADVLQRIYVKYKDDLMTLATALLYDRGSAEDVVHDVFVKFITSCGKQRLTRSLKGYLVTCVVNDARNKNKARRRHQSVSLEQVEPIASDSSMPDIPVMFGERSQRLAWALHQLPCRQRKILLLRLYNGLKFRTIARLENESINTIRGRYRYGLNKLRSLLNSEVKNETGR